MHRFEPITSHLRIHRYTNQAANRLFLVILTMTHCKSDTQASKGWKNLRKCGTKNETLRPSGYVLWQQERGREPKIGPTQKRTMMGRELQMAMCRRQNFQSFKKLQQCDVAIGHFSFVLISRSIFRLFSRFSIQKD